MNKLLFIQPLIASYCEPLFSELAKHYELTIVYSPVESKQGFGEEEPTQLSQAKLIKVPTLRPLGDKVGMYQSGIIKLIQQQNPDHVVIFSNIRYLSFWSTIVFCKLKGVSVYPHGHGLYKKHKPGILWRSIYKFMFWQITQYISYTKSVAQSLVDIDLPNNKISIAENSLENLYVVSPESRNKRNLGILFIGRLRAGCDLELLIEAAKLIRNNDGLELTLEIIGDGEQRKFYEHLISPHSWIHYHGAIYDDGKIKDISLNCSIGCYPGDAGLSIVHMMSLSLVPLTHGELTQHQGPEPSYLQHGDNGCLFEKGSIKSLQKNIIEIFQNPISMKHIQAQAHATYKDLTDPSLAKRFIKILDKN